MGEGRHNDRIGKLCGITIRETCRLIYLLLYFTIIGLFVSSGTQGNLISLMVHAKGFSAILGNKSHINVYE